MEDFEVPSQVFDTFLRANETQTMNDELFWQE